MKLIESCLRDEYSKDESGSIDNNNDDDNDNEKFTMPWCPVSVQDNFIETDLYTKSTDKHQYLLTSFCYPNTLSKRSILYTPLHFAFPAFALTKIVTYDVLMNL